MLRFRDIAGFVSQMPVLYIPSAWLCGAVVSVVRCMNDVTLRLARLVLGWVTFFGRVYHHVT